MATRLLGDFNLDGAVTNADLQAMLNALHNLNSYTATNNLSSSDLLALGDFNHDGVVDARDLQGFLSYLAGGGSGYVSVPEPPSIALMLVSFMMCVAQRSSARRKLG